ncbi:hypothetical protein HGRIS_007472 [Hohenbuehelia grisea]|uniref:Las1-domain-containing protein n=1 Tax=Hohenbuehelia grisea TaxID=104357 RepID=A0ABR3J6D0_9AGAR
MRLPRRVPWASLDELDQLCSWIYSESTNSTRQLAINRISAWKAITPIPHALESTLSLLVVLQQDNELKNSNASSSSSSLSYLSLRQSYAAAIIRLVNGLVDPLQLGAYAKSIAAIAAQIGLPAWLVELRHAATHEDLPSLELLRQAAKESMTWLLHNYFLPTLNPSSVPQTQAKPLPPLAPLLKRYKTLSKIIARDVTLTARYKNELGGVLRDTERWIGDAKVAANVAVGDLGWGPDSSGAPDAELDPREKWALERLCDALLEKGCLVPLSKRKRTFPADGFSPPVFSVVLWTPLLDHLFSNHPDLTSVLTTRIVSFLTAGQRDSATSEVSADQSYDSCLARWAFWLANSSSTLANTNTTTNVNVDNADLDGNLRDDLAAQLLSALGPGTRDSLRNIKALSELLNALCDVDPDLEAARALVAQPVNLDLASSTEWRGDIMSEMSQRLDALLALDTTAGLDSRAAQHTATNDNLLVEPSEDAKTVAPGWRLLDAASGWRPTPIGVHYPARLA